MKDGISKAIIKNISKCSKEIHESNKSVPSGSKVMEDVRGGFPVLLSEVQRNMCKFNSWMQNGRTFQKKRMY